MDKAQWKNLLYHEGVSGACFKCHRKTMTYDNYAEYCKALPDTGYVTFSFPDMQFGEVMLCGDCTSKVTAKEVVKMAKEKHAWLSAEYFDQKSKFVNMIKEKKNNEKLLARPSEFMC
jgi:hypothetical protein